MAANATRRRRITGAFQELFGAPPLIWARAPGRVDLMGSHTDYNLGSVLTLAIDLDVWIAGRPRADGQVRIHSLAMDATSCFRLDAIARDTGNGWSNYIRGVAAGLIGAGVRIGGFDAVIDSTIPLGSGLSSSAALECAAAVLFQSRAERKLSSLDTALLCQRAENEFVGVSCGILDQYTSYLGRSGCALLLDCGTLTHRAAPLHPAFKVVICDTRSPRQLAGSEYATRRADCEEGARRLGVAALRDATLDMLGAARLPDEMARRCRFIIEENRRVSRMANALAEGNAAETGTLCDESFRGARDLYRICSPAMSAMKAAMGAAPGVVGARQAGAGFGGCLVALVAAPCVAEFQRNVCALYESATGVAPAVYPVEAVDGAALLADDATAAG